jgi:hypothetical protein
MSWNASAARSTRSTLASWGRRSTARGNHRLLEHGEDVQSAEDPRSRRGRRLPPDTTWLDVRAVDIDGNWVPAEGERLVRVLTHLNHHGQNMAEVLVLTPFAHVADGIRRITREYPGLLTDPAG